VHYILTIRCDITKFNAYVKDLINSLMARGEMTHDLLENPFQAYKVVTDCKFIAYICKKEDQYEEGGENIDTDTLMLQADSKLKTMFKARTWNAPSPEEEKILALETQIQKLQKEKKKPKQEGGKKGKAKDGSKKGKKKKILQSG